MNSRFKGVVRSTLAVFAGVVVLAIVVRVVHDGGLWALGFDELKFRALAWPGLRLLFMHAWWWAGAVAGGVAVGLIAGRPAALHGTLAGSIAAGLVLWEARGASRDLRILDLSSWAAPWYASEAKSAFAALLFGTPIAAAAGGAGARALRDKLVRRRALGGES
jgi:hypothetical protein